VLYPSSFYPSSSLGCSVRLGQARCLCRASLVSFGSQTTRLEELNQTRYSSSRTCTHRWLAVSLLCCSRGARGLANRPIAPSPSRRLTLACEEGCAYAELLCRQSARILAHPLRRSSAASHDDNNKMTTMTISLDTSTLPSLGHHTPTYVVDRSCLVPALCRDGACYCCCTVVERDARVLISCSIPPDTSCCSDTHTYSLRQGRPSYAADSLSISTAPSTLYWQWLLHRIKWEPDER